jgi:hypothetical protein
MEHPQVRSFVDGAATMCSSDIKSAGTNPKGAWITSGLTVIRQQLGKLGFSIRRERSLSESAKV